MKKYLLLAFAFLFLISSQTYAIDLFATKKIISKGAFSDVPHEHEYYDSIKYLQNNKIIKGYPDGKFKPEGTLNRAEIVKILIESTADDLEINNCNSDETFSDISDEDWFTPYVCVARKNGIINGYSDGSFKPGNTLNFAESSKIIAKAYGHNLSDGEPWYRPYVEKLEDLKAIPQAIDRFDQAITRAEMAEMIYRIKNNVTNKANKGFSEIQ